MILLVSVFITDKKLYSNRTSNSGERLDIFKYTLASYSVLPISKTIILVKLDTNYKSREKELVNYIKELFENPIIINDRFTTKQEWKESGILDIIIKESDDLIWFTQNDDHVFIDSSLDVLNNSLNLLKEDNSKYKSLCYSHYPEHISLGAKLNAEKNGLCIKINYPMSDSIQILNKSYLIFLLQEVSWLELNMIRIDTLVRDTRIWGIHGTKEFNIDCSTYIPLKELCRHFDGYYHVKIDDKICPPLFIPRNFFDNSIIIKYGYDEYDTNVVNINPCKILRVPNNVFDTNIHTDITGLLSDIPLFWKNRIKKIDINDKISLDKFKKCRNVYYKNLMELSHENWWTNGVKYEIPKEWCIY